MMIPSQKCLDLASEFEGIELSPYLDPVGIPTIGRGSTRYEDGSPVTMNDPPITEERAESLFKLVMYGFCAQAMKLITVNITQGECDAITDFCYNEGIGHFASSTLLKKLNMNDKIGAANEFVKWDIAGGHVLPGLLRRRIAEKELFLS